MNTVTELVDQTVITETKVESWLMSQFAYEDSGL